MTSIPRRHFLASTSAVAAPLLGMEAALAKQAAAPNIQQGAAWKFLAVAPLSRKIPDLESHYRRGMELGLSRNEGVHVQLHWIGAHALPNAAAKSIETALNEVPGLEGVVGWMPPELERRVAAMTHARGLPLWVSDTGADARPESAAMPLRAQGYNSLDLCAQVHSLAKDVMRHQGPRAVVVMGWMESGYDFVTTFEHAYRALGGQIVGRHVGGPKEQAKEFDGLRRTVFEHRPDAVVAFYSGPQAKRFTQWWRSNAHAQGHWTLATLPWMTEANELQMTQASPKPLPDVVGSNWQDTLQQAEVPLSAASMLGVDAGDRIGSSLSRLRPHADADAVADAWAKASSHSPVTYQQSSSGWLNGYLQT